MISIDLFAGGGGASLGIEWATGSPPIAAVNHDAAAIEMHAANHADSHHFHEDVFQVSPYEAAHGHDIDLLWASPDCTHFSRAKGGKPKSKKIRGLAWVIVDWAISLRPRIICMENVAEFQTWGPLDDQGHAIKERKGETFEEFVGKLRQLGYVVEWRVLSAADYGAPTIRKRLFLVARCDGEPIRWPDPTHGPGRKPYRTAAECINWEVPCLSIFERKRPLAESTCRRIAHGIMRHVVSAKRPFILNLTHGGRVEDIDEPFKKITAANRGEKALVTAAFIAKHYTGVVGQGMSKPLGTVTSIDHHSLVSAHLTKFYGTSKSGTGLHDPMPTVTGQGQHIGLVAAFLTTYYGPSKHGAPVDCPVMIDGVRHVICDIGMRMLTPRELARAQGFPDDYILTGTQTNQVAKIGNSVCPHVVAALIAAQSKSRQAMPA